MSSLQQGRARVRPAPRHRGVALLLVVIALVIATILSLTFLAGQSTTIGIARNLDRHGQARQVAETGLELALREVESNPDWRDDHASGEWVTAAPFAGGTFSVWGVDGLDDDGDGTISVPAEGDGDLADDPEDPVTLTVVGAFEGVTHRVVAEVRPDADAGGGGPFAGAVFGGEGIEIVGSAAVDSWDSRLGPYSSSNSGEDAVVATNSTADQAVSATGNSTYYGDVYVGPGADPASVFDGDESVTGGVTGTVQNLDEPLTFDIPPHLIEQPSSGPFTAGGAPGWVYLPPSGVGGDLRLDSLTAGGAKKIRVRGDLRLRVDGDVNIGGNSGLELDTDASLTMWVSGSVTFGAGVPVNHETADPTRVVIYVLEGGDVRIQGAASVYATIIAPESDADILGAAELFGTFQGNSLRITGTGALHQDLALAEADLGGVGGGSDEAAYRVRWVEEP